MCGRFACTLGKQDLVKACTYRGIHTAAKGVAEKVSSIDQGSHPGKGCSKFGEQQNCDEADFGDEDDSFLLETSIPKIDAFTPSNQTAFHYAPFMSKKGEEKMVQEETAQEELDFEEEDETFLLEASINAESALESESDQVVDFVPTWKDAPCGNTYRPSSNIPPTAYTPVLFWQEDGGPVIQPMLWGLVPPWHRGENPTSHGMSTNNARLEGVQSSKLYGPCLNKRRCVIICDGFYEWKRNQTAAAKEKGNKQPYYIYREDQKNEDSKTLEESPRARLLFMAGIYSVGEGAGGKQIYSYSVLTREADSSLSWLHHRMPCFLNPSLLHPWLTLSSSKAALDLLLQPIDANLAWHPVSRDVGNVRNQSMDLNKKVEEGEEKLPERNKKSTNSSAASKGLMANWLKRGQAEVGEEKTLKRVKKGD